MNSLAKNSALNSVVHRKSIKAHKKFQSAHISPARDYNQEKLSTSSFSKKLKFTERTTAAYLPVSRKSSESKISRSQKSLLMVKKSLRKSEAPVQPQPRRIQGNRLLKENTENVQKGLRRGKIRQERTGRGSSKLL